MARETENLGLYLADDEDTFQNYVKNQSASMNHNMEILDSYIYEELNDKVNKDDYATTSAAGLVKPDGTTVTVDADGTIHGASTYELPTASASVKGGIKVGDHLHMNDEVLSADGGIAVQDTEPTDVDVWVDTDEFGADFCYVGDTEPPNDGSVAVWVDTSEDERVSNIEVGDTAPTDDSVQIWVDTSQGANLADYIVEEGTSGIWTYRKWASGIAECWGKFSQNVSAYAQGAFVVGDTSVSAYPFNFVSAPFLTVMVQRVGTGGGYATYDYDRTNYANFIVNGSSPTPIGTAMDITAKCYAIGRWK